MAPVRLGLVEEGTLRFLDGGHGSSFLGTLTIPQPFHLGPGNRHLGGGQCHLMHLGSVVQLCQQGTSGHVLVFAGRDGGQRADHFEPEGDFRPGALDDAIGGDLIGPTVHAPWHDRIGKLGLLLQGVEAAHPRQGACEDQDHHRGSHATHSL